MRRSNANPECVGDPWNTYTNSNSDTTHPNPDPKRGMPPLLHPFTHGYSYSYSYSNARPNTDS